MVDQKLMASLPKVDQVLDSPAVAGLREEMPAKLVKEGVRLALQELRDELLEDRTPPPEEMSVEAVASRAADLAQNLARPSLRRVVNATGVVVHTNLGRSLLAPVALERIQELNRTYTNLEYDLPAGKRGSRYVHVAALLEEVTGAEAALVVNNNAGAVFLSLQTMAQGKEVIVSRGQLVEIGGSFRIPDVMARSGAILREVGTTNKTHLRDYENAITSDTALLLKVHTSNFAVVGFHQEVELKRMKELGLRYHLPVMEDLGSGTLVDFSLHGMPPEPTVQQALAQGADLVSFSGDKLLGGPQAGIILGRRDLIERIRTNPLNRALRIDKMTLAALEATLEIYREPEKVLREIPTLEMITRPYEKLRRQAQSLVRKLRALKLERLKVRAVDGVSRVGGGALPLAAPPSKLLQIEVEGLSATQLEKKLRGSEIPVICRMEDGRLLMDVRTLTGDDDKVIAGTLARLCA